MKKGDSYKDIKEFSEWHYVGTQLPNNELCKNA
jgi:hypothetical protein